MASLFPLKFKAVNDFAIIDRYNTIWNVRKDTILLVDEAPDPWCGLAAKITAIWTMGENQTTFVIEAAMDRQFHDNVVSINEEPKSVDLSPKIIVAPHLQVKTFDNEGELNEFLANRLESDIVSVTPFLISTESYLGMRFSVLYKVS